MTDKERIDSLFKKTSDYADEIMKLKQENNALKERVAELENASKKKRKFRAMTIGEHCTVRRTECIDCEYHRGWYYCDYSDFNKVNRGRNKNKPYKTKDGKYILIEVKE